MKFFLKVLFSHKFTLFGCKMPNMLKSYAPDINLCQIYFILDAFRYYSLSVLINLFLSVFFFKLKHRIKHSAKFNAL